jgi:hypothetical protein
LGGGLGVDVNVERFVAASDGGDDGIEHEGRLGCRGGYGAARSAAIAVTEARAVAEMRR